MNSMGVLGRASAPWEEWAMIRGPSTEQVVLEVQFPVGVELFGLLNVYDYGCNVSI